MSRVPLDAETLADLIDQARFTTAERVGFRRVVDVLRAHAKAQKWCCDAAEYAFTCECAAPSEDAAEPRQTVLDPRYVECSACHAFVYGFHVCKPTAETPTPLPARWDWSFLAGFMGAEEVWTSRGLVAAVDRLASGEDVIVSAEEQRKMISRMDLWRTHASDYLDERNEARHEAATLKRDLQAAKEENERLLEGIPFERWEEIKAENSKLREAVRELRDLFANDGTRRIAALHVCDVLARTKGLVE